MHLILSTTAVNKNKYWSDYRTRHFGLIKEKRRRKKKSWNEVKNISCQKKIKENKINKFVGGWNLIKKNKLMYFHLHNKARRKKGSLRKCINNLINMKRWSFYRYKKNEF